MSLHTKYRPKTFKQFIGQGAITASLEKALDKGLSHCFLLVGPSGVGKTSLARAAALKLGCKRPDEINAAKFTGVDDMRALTDTLQYRPFGDEPKVIIVDEAHMISKAGWNSLLKDTEEPPDWCYWFLCTTDVGKVPATIKTRCTTYTLKLVDVETLYELILDICNKEKLNTNNKILRLCAEEAQGSPRQAIVNLEVCMEAKDLEEAKELLQSASESPQAIDLARALIKGAKWKDIQGLLRGMKDLNPESVRHVVRAYITAVALNNPNPKIIEILDEFCTPFNSGDGISPLLVACAKVVLS